jgi:hypothetical protein
MTQKQYYNGFKGGKMKLPFYSYKADFWPSLMKKAGTDEEKTEVLNQFIFKSIEELQRAMSEEPFTGEKQYRSTLVKTLREVHRIAVLIRAETDHYLEGFILCKEWFLIIYTQFSMAGAIRLGKSKIVRDRLDYAITRLGFSFKSCLYPRSDSVRTVLECTHDVDDGSVISYKMVFEPTDPFPAGCVVRANSGKLYDVSTRNDDGTYTVIAHECTNGIYRDYVMTPWQMSKMKRADEHAFTTIKTNKVQQMEYMI